MTAREAVDKIKKSTPQRDYLADPEVQRDLRT